LAHAAVVWWNTFVGVRRDFASPVTVAILVIIARAVDHPRFTGIIHGVGIFAGGDRDAIAPARNHRTESNTVTFSRNTAEVAARRQRRARNVAKGREPLSLGGLQACVSFSEGGACIGRDDDLRVLMWHLRDACNVLFAAAFLQKG